MFAFPSCTLYRWIDPPWRSAQTRAHALRTCVPLRAYYAVRPLPLCAPACLHGATHTRACIYTCPPTTFRLPARPALPYLTALYRLPCSPYYAASLPADIPIFATCRPCLTPRYAAISPQTRRHHHTVAKDRPPSPPNALLHGCYAPRYPPALEPRRRTPAYMVL